MKNIDGQVVFVTPLHTHKGIQSSFLVLLFEQLFIKALLFIEHLSDDLDIFFPVKL